MLTFFRKTSFTITAEYAEPELLLPGTPAMLGSYTFNLDGIEDAIHVKVQSLFTMQSLG